MYYYEAEQQEVVEAALILDRIKPKWYKRIDLTKLNMMSATNCILGQVFRAELLKPWTWGSWGQPYIAGRKAVRRVGFVPRFGVFVSDKAIPNWEKEIAQRLK